MGGGVGGGWGGGGQGNWCSRREIFENVYQNGIFSFSFVH